uniref:HAMP domain-containing protein n=1 Tax=Pararhizobium sp. IMCC3301 TaxID=3067904 RepID=UPI0027416775|nr:HAMP domain-containing protein [Pararhizobium sp. IMCC3301]
MEKTLNDDQAMLKDKQLLAALRGFRRGDFSTRLPESFTGTDGEIAEAFNDVVSQNQALTNELARLQKSFGRDGRTGERAKLDNVSGGWRHSIDSINELIGDTVQQTAEISRVVSAVAQGDLSQSMDLEVDGRRLKGDFLSGAKTINTMVDRLGIMSSEVTRVAREVGTEGKLGGQAKVKGVAGTWKDLTDNVNAMATNLTGQVRNIAEVTTAVARGDLSKKITVDVKGEILELKDTINTMVDQLNSFASEVTRVAREVGTEGQLGGQAKVEGVAGTWKDLTDNVNSMAGNLTVQLRDVSKVATAIASGDLTQKITVDVQGEILQIKDVINTMVDQLSSFASEVTRVAREVGTEGQLGGQAQVEGVDGTWKDLTENVNAMATNLTGQVRNIAEVTTAVARGDLSKKITVNVQGEILELKDTINTMVDQLSSFASEVTRVAREVGTEGKLGGQAKVEGVAGTWKNLTDNVNSMAGNLTVQLRDVSKVATAIASGDLTQKITVDVKGEILQIKDVINTMVDQLSSFASEVTRVARDVGGEGKLGVQAKVEGVAGTWKDLTDNVNSMAGNLTVQLRDVSKVATAIASGDLTQKITVDVQGEILQIKDVINTMVDQLSSFADEVTRVAREVGTEGKLGGQAQVEGVDGIWKDLTTNVNAMATNLTGQVRNIAEVTTAVARGDLSKKITVDVKGEIEELKDTINTMVDQLNSFASEVTRVAREVGTEGKLGGEARVEGVDGTWKDLTQNVNAMATNLTGQVRNIADVTTAVARGDLSRKITVDVKGEILELKNTINTMVDQLNGFASEVTRVAREVGTQGKLGGQAKVEGVAGTWKDLTDNVNMMATNLTNQVRGIAQVVTAVANGNMKRKLTVDAKGEIAELAETINGMIDTLATFGDQVTDVAREVGIEGKLGGQAKVPGAAGLWRDLTDNVNQLADNLTTQVRAITEVATAVADGDLTRSISVQASGEVAALKDKINQMIGNLRETTKYNEEQDWLKTNLARFTRMMQGERDMVTVCNLVMSEIAPLIEVQHGVLYVLRHDAEGDGQADEKEKVFELTASYALNERKHISNTVTMRKGLVGQCAFERQRILVTNVPNDYVTINSGLGEAPPLNIVVLPVIFEEEVLAVIELASFQRFTPIHLSILDELVESIGIVLNTISAGMRTEELLKQSQILTRELQSQQEELTNTNDRLKQHAVTMRKSEELLKSQQDELRTKNEELEDKAVQLQVEKRQVEAINREVETARSSLEEKAEQLALTSKYKSEFLANMSHELRTPLNSLLILSKLLADNTRGNLNPKQIEQSETIHSAGADLLRMINDILDLSKIESGTVDLDIEEMQFEQFAHQTERTFREIAEQKKVEFTIEIGRNLPRSMTTDAMRLQQIINNLLSNAFKFTDEGSVALTVSAAKANEVDSLRIEHSEDVVTFSIIDTGIGIGPAQQQIIFEAFQQADGTTSRRYGGTGLGLSISRELASLLGGEIRLSSEIGKGSSFVLVLPIKNSAPVQPRRADAPALSHERVNAPLVAHIAPAEIAAPALSVPQAVPSEVRDQPLIMIVEDDPIFSRILREIAEEQGFSSMSVARGREVMTAIRQYRPDALSLDIQLPDIDGWALLDMMKSENATRHLPIHVISVVEDQIRLRSHMGSVEFSGKPASRDELKEVFTRLKLLTDRKDRALLVVNFGKTKSAAEAFYTKVKTLKVLTETPRKATAMVKDQSFDSILITGTKLTREFAELLRTIRQSEVNVDVPVLLELETEPDAAQTEMLAEVGAMTFTASHDQAQILDELISALHLPVESLPSEVRASVTALQQRAPILKGLKIAVIDDDVRNIFSLTALLEEHEIEVLQAENGQDGIELLKDNEGVFAALIDIMMPGMDGYETIRRIRKMKRLKDLPLIAITAKAMPEDREKCFEVGASDYLSKPVDNDELIAVLRTWVKRSSENDEAFG